MISKKCKYLTQKNLNEFFSLDFLFLQNLASEESFQIWKNLKLLVILFCMYAQITVLISHGSNCTVYIDFPVLTAITAVS